ncbi:MAG: nucleoside-diphosphate kinase [Nanobdellota archaeon]
MTTEQTLILLKPDAVLRGLIGEIISRFERCGMKITAMKMLYADEANALKHYDMDESWFEKVGQRIKEKKSLDVDPIELGKEVQQQLASYITHSPIVALVVESHNAVKQVRKLVGETSPEESLPGTIRGDFTFDSYGLANVSNRPIMNVIHASGSVQEAQQEIKVWFKPEEIHSWKRLDEDFLYLKDILNKNN